MADESKTLVLVADDEPSTRALVVGHLKRKGYRVVEASDGDEAWELAHEQLPDLVVLDVMMPGMSGWEVCRKIREAVSLAHTGVVMLTGIGEHLNEMTSPLYGADAYVDKPFEFSVLDAKVQETLARRRSGTVGRGDAESAPRPKAEKKAKPAKAMKAKAEPAPKAKKAAKAEAPVKPAKAKKAKKAKPAKAKKVAKPQKAKRAAKPQKAKKAAKPAKAKKAAKPAKAKKAAKPAKTAKAKKAAKPAKAKKAKPASAKKKKKRGNR